MKTALVLSGGGATGSFEVGVLKYLYLYDFRPDLITSTSVGSVNGLKLAEGEGGPSQGFQGLLDIWLGLETNNDMYVEDDWFAGLPDWIRELMNGGDPVSIFGADIAEFFTAAFMNLGMTS